MATRRYYLAIDLGTSHIAALALDIVSGKIRTTSKNWDPAEASRTTYRESDPFATIDVALHDVVRPLVQSLGGAQVMAIGVTGQMHGTALIQTDQPGVALSPFVDWRDSRCDESMIAEMTRRVGEGAYNTGCTMASGYMAATLFWLSKHGRLPTDRSVASFLPDLLVSRLSGQPPVTDHTNAGSSGVFDVLNHQWATELIDRLGLPSQLFPPIVEPGTIAGQLTPDVASSIGLPSGIPVVAAIGDNQASYIGSVPRPTNDVLVNIGTGGQVAVLVDSYVTTHPDIDVRCFTRGNYLLVGTELTGGSSYASLHAFYAQVIQDLGGRRPSDRGLYARMEKIASIPDRQFDGPSFNPRFRGTRSQPNGRASIDRLSEQNFRPGNLTRSLLEGMAASYHELFTSMPELARKGRDRIIGSGNGLRRNALLRNSLANQFGLPIHIPKFGEEAALGAALHAAMSTGGVDPSELPRFLE